ncbi:Haloacid dehalogenase-like hydrolase domain-containing protein [Chaetoceros tenuissimus]|uniref:Haloacid dehalogenase-like hydrolase domain-containing protein n=1 Tax=Chaetoceros tenuissimus TaxID=426638 RepID=A0AAD3DBD7_9STRA|nr:Haloacid dehalogenase-like hydrolase domain-containing protein [Chaetoceros tenuissimus]
MSGINQDGTLKKIDKPKATTEAAIAASTGDLQSLQTVKHTFSMRDESGNIPLIWAADQGQDQALEYILENMPEEDEMKQDTGINVKGYLGNTALGRAARGGHTKCCQLLLNRKDINPNICNEKMQYPLHFAAFKKHPETVKIMLDSGKCSTLVKDRKGRTPAEDTSVEEIKEMILAYREKTGM